jgi:hypothetical protein
MRKRKNNGVIWKRTILGYRIVEQVSHFNILGCDVTYKYEEEIYGVPEGKAIFWEVMESVILRKSLYGHVSYSERFPTFGWQYSEFGPQCFPSIPL